MKKTFYILSIIFFLSITSCDLFTPDSHDNKRTKPSISSEYSNIKTDYPRDINIENQGLPEWYPTRRLIPDNGLDFVNSLYRDFSIQYDQNPASFGGIVFPHITHVTFKTPIQIMEDSVFSDIDVFKNSLKEFVYDWRRLFTFQEFIIDSIEINQADELAKVFIKKYYIYPVINNFDRYTEGMGCIEFHFNNNGMLTGMSSTLMAHMNVPINPTVGRDSLINLLVGYHYYWTEGGNSRNFDHIIQSQDIKSTVLKVYLYRDVWNYVDFRLAWCIKTYPITSGTESNFTINLIIDAMTGEFLWE